MNEWINAKDNLPEKATDYLCRCIVKDNTDYPFFMVLRYIMIDVNPHFQHECDGGLRVTHWMPIPELQCNFDYGIITYKHRFSINRSLSDYEEITLNKCIRTGIQHKYKTAGCDKLIAEMQIVYKDENDKLQCLCLDLHDWTFSIKHVGDMMCNL